MLTLNHHIEVLIIIIIIIIYLFIYHLYAGYLCLFTWNKPCF